jgi:hypothetical protein
LVTTVENQTIAKCADLKEAGAWIRSRTVKNTNLIEPWEDNHHDKHLSLDPYSCWRSNTFDPVKLSEYNEMNVNKLNAYIELLKSMHYYG